MWGMLHGMHGGHVLVLSMLGRRLPISFPLSSLSLGGLLSLLALSRCLILAGSLEGTGGAGHWGECADIVGEASVIHRVQCDAP